MGAAARAHVVPASRPTSHRAPAVQTRRHGGRVAGPRPMVRATIGIQATSRPSLALVPRRRRAASIAVVMSTLVVLSMLGAAAFQTQLAKRQLQLDQLDSNMSSSREQYEVLRRQRSELRSPARLNEIATTTGMKAADDTGFTVISSEVYALVQQSTGQLEQHTPTYAESLLDGYRVVKGLSEEAP